jgi:hypothetical protein
MGKTAKQLDREIAEALDGSAPSRRSTKTRPRRARVHHSTKSSARKIGSIGDVNPIDYGGGYIFSGSGGGGPTLEYFEGLDDDERASRIHAKVWDSDEAEAKIDKLGIQLYQVDLEKDGKSFLSSYDWVDWDSVAQSTGQDPSAYSASELTTAQKRAMAVWDAASVNGWFEFDQYPLSMTVGELKARWKE